jgi:hypothetical protein
MENIKLGDIMTMSKKAKKAGVLSGVAVSISVLICVGVFLGSMDEPVTAKPVKADEHLFVEETYLLKTGETNETVNVTCTPYITNTWDEDSGDIKIIAYIVKTNNNIADYKNTVEIGKINADTTAEIEIPVILSENTYRVDMLIFENEKLVLKGSLTIIATQHFIYDMEGNILSQNWSLKNSACDFEQISH